MELARKLSRNSHRHDSALGYPEKQDRVAFENEFWVHLSKAANTAECAPKEKHVRMVILGTHKYGGSLILFIAGNRLGIQGLPLVCWKFCYILHRVLRDGHEKSIQDCQRFAGRMLEIGKMWANLREGCGPLVTAYTKLLSRKLAFHAKYEAIAGNLSNMEDQLAKQAGDPKFDYQLAADTFDYIDAHLHLVDTVLDSIDRARSISVTERGQCRLIPLLLSIQECTFLYDLVVRALFRLHEHFRNGDEKLDAHVRKFEAMYPRLKSFFDNAGTIQYFRTLMQVPVLRAAPNFRIAAEFAMYKSKGVPQATLYSDQNETPARSKPALSVSVPASDSTSDLPRSASATGPSEASEAVFLASSTASRLTASRPVSTLPVANENKAAPVADRPTWAFTDDSPPASRSQSEWAFPTDIPSFADESAWTPVQDDSQKPPSEDLHALIRKLTDENERLRKELQKLIHDSKVRIDDLLTRIKSLEDKLAGEDYEKVSHNVVEKHPHYVELRTAYDSRRDQVTKLRALLVDLQTEHANTIRTNAELRERLAQLQLKQQEPLMTVDVSHQTNSALQSNQSEILSQKEELARLQTDLEVRAQQYAALETRLVELDALRTDLSSSLSLAQQQIDKLQNLAKQLSVENDSLQKQVANNELHVQQSNGALRTTCLREFLRLLTTHIAENTELRFNAFLGTLHPVDKNDVSDDVVNITDERNAPFNVARAVESIQQLLAFLRSRNQADNRQEFVSVVLKLGTLIDSLLRDGTLLRVQSVEQADELNALVLTLRGTMVRFLGALEHAMSDSDVSETDGQVQDACDALTNVLSQLQTLVLTLKRETMEERSTTQEPSLSLEAEIAQAQNQVELIASKLTQMLAEQRGSQRSALQIEVNEKILAACNQLMLAIRVLIEKSRVLQREIAQENEQHKADTCVSQSYKKSHRWTEGLISAAKAVGWSANYLSNALTSSLRSTMLLSWTTVQKQTKLNDRVLNY